MIAHSLFANNDLNLLEKQCKILPEGKEIIIKVIAPLKITK
jgi:hypothetical protein